MPTVHHIPACPFSQRLQILLAVKGCSGVVDFHVVDITQPRPPELLALADGSTALPLLVADDGTVLRESLVILRYLDTLLPRPVAQPGPLQHAVEDLLAALAGDFGDAGYRLLLNREPARRNALCDALLAQYTRIDTFLRRHAQGSPWLFDRFGWAETVFTPLFMRFWFLGYYERFELPQAGFERVHAWQQACVEHPAAQGVTREQIVKLYADYAWGAGNGRLLPGRTLSSFAFTPHWAQRPWPPRDKYGPAPSDAELGLLG